MKNINGQGNEITIILPHKKIDCISSHHEQFNQIIHQSHTNTADEKQEKTEKRKANLQTCKTCSISTPTHVRVHYNATK
jgi:hypothetical protein